MKKIPVIVFFIFVSFFHGSTFAQSGSAVQAGAPAQSQLRDSTSPAQAFHFTDSLFDRAEFTYDVAEPDIPKEIQSILARFSNAVSADKEWFIDYRNKYAATG